MIAKPTVKILGRNAYTAPSGKRDCKRGNDDLIGQKGKSPLARGKTRQ